MSDVWTRDRVLSLAPDSASASAGQSLAQARKWKTLGQSEQALWGEIQGSGSKPYQTRIDLNEPAFKCSCPSRKFPCKHGLGLFLIYAADAGALKAVDPPGWVSEWLADREQRAVKKTEKAEAKAAEPRDEEAAARRVAAREEKIASGLDELSLWMEDLIRQGLAAAQAQSSQFWENMAARLVDAQAPGLARRVRDLSSAAFSGEGWQQRLLAGLGRLALLVAAYRRWDHLPAELAADVRGDIGWTRSQEEVLAQAGVADTWCVVGRRVTHEEQLRVQRTWLWGEQTSRWALVLHFAAGAQPLDTSLPVGTKSAGELAYFPSAAPLRAIVKSAPAAREAMRGLAGGTTISQALDDYADALARHPWIERWPMTVRDVVIQDHIGDGRLTCAAIDSAEDRVELQLDEDACWQLVAIGCGRPLSLCGEWDGTSLWPLAASMDGRYFSLVASDAGQALVRVA